MGVRIIKANAQGLPVGESHPNCRYPDSLVEKARAMRAQGETLRGIAAELGVAHPTIYYWTSGRLRQPAVRVVARRIKPE